MTSTFITYLGGLADQVGRDERSELQAKILHVNPAVPLDNLPVKLRRPGVALHPLPQTVPKLENGLTLSIFGQI